MNFKNEDALVLMSGGMDSTTTLLWGLKNFKNVYAITFFYNQKHNREIEIATKICKELNVEQKIVDISFLKEIAISNLFTGENDVNKSHPLNENVPASFVPYRNLLFLTIASAWASTLNVRHIATGVCQTDYSGYADCRDIFIKSTQVTLNLATDFKDEIIIHTPLMYLDKAETFKLAKDLGGLDLVLKRTLSCYNGIEKMNDYGMGCGECPACLLRKKGYEKFQKEY
ncbi:MAG TPA: 7-cyano-7-deazaguanine synthase QueC [Spirochaetota bacterium]|nr:7-cyano-7-deazaguanine synthase QueC [Spirochaetota bacterium]HOL56170.1 7-cyano-7-deazaguanine synthase QueC [Spirochaetota bacterium]